MFTPISPETIIGLTTAVLVVANTIVSKIARKEAAKVKEKFEEVSEDTKGRLDVIHDLCNSRLTDALAEISILRDTIAHLRERIVSLQHHHRDTDETKD